MATTPVITSIPSPDETPGGLYQTVVALKQSVDIEHGYVKTPPRAPTAVTTSIGAAISAVIRLNP